jgi:hypothetical protein
MNDTPGHVADRQREVLRFSPAACVPARADVLSTEGIAGSGPPSAVTDGLLSQALDIFVQQAAPAGVYTDIKQTEFGRVFAGEGLNDPDAPLARIYPRADRLALFACTLGPDLNREISRLFEEHDYALGYVLDAVASCGTERVADLLEQEYCRRICDEPVSQPSPSVVRYSPGYCGWHVSGQRRLFRYLCPEVIGITLRESFLMEPLKSISGVFVLGPKQIHRFDNTFGFCLDCRSATCRSRQARLESAKE